MNGRRNFLKFSAATAIVSTLTPGIQTLASEKDCYSGIVYSKQSSGKWTKKTGSHAPVVHIENDKVSVLTNHGMSSKHYIVRHTLVLANGKVVGGKTFFPTDKPESSYTLPAGYKGPVYATSFCNRHDLWVTKVTV